VAEVIFWLLFFGAYCGGAVYMILNPEAVGQASGAIGHGYVDKATPGCLVRFAGCAILAVWPGVILGRLTGYWWIGVVAGVPVAIGLYLLAGRWWPLDE
jgi:hypothetical protein